MEVRMGADRTGDCGLPCGVVLIAIVVSRWKSKNPSHDGFFACSVEYRQTVKIVKPNIHGRFEAFMSENHGGY
jgi:hypothetical protein